MVQYRLKLLGQWRAFQRVLCVCVLSRFSCVWFFATLWTVAHQALCPGEPYVSIIIREMLSHVDSLQWKEIFKAYDLLRYLPSVLSGWLIKFKHIIGLKINHEFLYLEGISHIFSWPCLCLHEQKEMEMAFLWFIYKAPSAFTDFFELQSLFSDRCDLKLRDKIPEKKWWALIWMGFPHTSVGKESACNAGDPGSIPGLERSAGEVIGYLLQYSWVSLVAQLVKNLPAMWETWVWSLGWEDTLEKGKATNSSILAWGIPWGPKELDMTEWLSLSLFTFLSVYEHWDTGSRF